MKQPRFTLRDLCWLVLVATMGFGCSTAEVPPVVGETVTATQTREPSTPLVVKVHDPEPVALDAEAVFDVEIENTGTETATGITITDTFGEELEHKSGQASPLIASIGSLNAGEKQRLTVTFIVRHRGRHRHTVVVAANGFLTSKEAFAVAE